MTTLTIFQFPKQLSFMILITVSASVALCPFGRSKRIFGHLGFIRADEGYDVDDICEWKIYAPLEKKKYSISIVISRIACDRNLFIEGEEFCRQKPRVSRTYNPDSCKQDCEASNCRKFKGYPLIVTYGRYAIDRGFVIRFSYEPCVPDSFSVSDEEEFKNVTTSPMQSAAISRDPVATNRSMFKVTAADNMLATTTIQEPSTSVFNSSRNTSDVDIPTIAIASSIAVAVVVVIVAIAIFKNTRAEKPEVTQDHVTYVTTVQCSVERDFETAKSSLYEIIETDAATTPAYSNEGYQTLPTAGGTYAENNYGTVFQPPVKDVKRTDSDKYAGHIYEEVTPEDGSVVSSNMNPRCDEFVPDSDSFEDDSSEHDSDQ